MNETIILSNEEVNKLIQENNEDIRYVRELTESRLKGSKIPNNFMEFLVDAVNDIYVDGNAMDYGDRIVIEQGEHRRFYRGENRDYVETLTSLGRAIKGLNFEESIAEQFVEKMRIKVFSDFLERTLPVKYYKNKLLSLGYNNITEKKVTPFYDAIAQHYGFRTDLLDITSDLNVALFFACCRYEDGKWRPLNEEECKKNKYSVLYMAYADSIRFVNAANKKPVLVPVGYQPFMRCEAQNAYVLHLDDKNSLSTFPYFKKYLIEHTPQDCINIFSLMGQGNKIFPHESLTELFSNEIDDMKKLTSFTDDTYKYVYDNYFKYKIKEKAIKPILFKNGIEIYNGTLRNKISRQRIHRLDLKYEAMIRKDDKPIFARKTLVR